VSKLRQAISKQKKKSRFQTKLWNEYVWKKQSVSNLTEKYKRSNKWIRQQLDQVKIKVSNDSTNPQPITIVADATFFGRTYGIIVFREPNLKKNLCWKEVTVENLSAYWQGRTFLEKKGFVI